MEINKYIDHTLLKATATKEEIIKLCNEAKEYNFYSVCVNSGIVKFAADQVNGTDVKVAAVVGFPHEIKGEGIYVYVVLKEGYEPSKDFEKLLISHIRQMIGPIATPDKIQFAGGLPKTRSGKIMRRILRKIASGALEELGDTSTLADPSVIEELISDRK